MTLDNNSSIAVNHQQSEIALLKMKSPTQMIIAVSAILALALSLMTLIAPAAGAADVSTTQCQQTQSVFNTGSYRQVTGDRTNNTLFDLGVPVGVNDATTARAAVDSVDFNATPIFAFEGHDQNNHAFNNAATQRANVTESILVVDEATSFHLISVDGGAMKVELGLNCGAYAEESFSFHNANFEQTPTIALPVGVHRLRTTNVDVDGGSSFFDLAAFNSDTGDFEFDFTGTTVIYGEIEPIDPGSDFVFNTTVINDNGGTAAPADFAVNANLPDALCQAFSYAYGDFSAGGYFGRTAPPWIPTVSGDYTFTAEATAGAFGEWRIGTTRTGTEIHDGDVNPANMMTETVTVALTAGTPYFVGMINFTGSISDPQINSNCPAPFDAGNNPVADGALEVVANGGVFSSDINVLAGYTLDSVTCVEDGATLLNLTAPVDQAAITATAASGTSTVCEYVLNDIATPGIELTKTATVNDADNNGINAGDTITYNFTVTNTGNTALTNITITDPLVTVTGTIPTLTPGASDSTTFTATYTITQTDIDNGTVTNQATATGQDPNGQDVTDDSDDPTTTDHDNNPNTPDTNNDPTITELEQNPSIELTKTATVNDADNNGINAGDTITYNFTVTNTGNTALTNITITDPLVTVTGTIPTLTPGASDSTTFTATYTITQTDIDNGTVTNQATATGQDPNGQDVTDDSDDPTTTDHDNNPNTPDTNNDPTITDVSPPSFGTPPAALAFTGTESRTLTMAAVLITLIGLGLTFASRKKDDEETESSLA